MRALESIAICRPADAATGSTRELARLATGSVFPADHDGRLYCLTKEGLVPELLPFYQCASPQQYQWAKEEALLLTKLRTETDRCCQKEQSRALIRRIPTFCRVNSSVGFIMMLICGSVSPSSFAFPATAMVNRFHCLFSYMEQVAAAEAV